MKRLNVIGSQREDAKYYLVTVSSDKMHAELICEPEDDWFMEALSQSISGQPQTLVCVVSAPSAIEAVYTALTVPFDWYQETRVSLATLGDLSDKVRPLGWEVCSSW